MKASDQDLLFKSHLTQCLEHPLFQCLFLHLNKNAKRSKICSECKSESNLRDQDVFPIAELLTYPEKEITVGFPFSKDAELIEFFSKLKTTPDTMVEKIETFFDQMQVTINNKIHEAKKSALKQAAEIIFQRELVEKSFENTISTLNELKVAVLKLSEEDLNNFIQVKIESQDVKINQLKVDIARYSKELAKFNIETQLEKVKTISKHISNIDCYSVKETLHGLPSLDDCDEYWEEYWKEEMEINGGTFFG